MTDKQVFVTILGGIVSAILGGDDGWGIIWLALSILCGIVGLILSAKWARKRFPDPAL